MEFYVVDEIEPYQLQKRCKYNWQIRYRLVKNGVVISEECGAPSGEPLRLWRDIVAQKEDFPDEEPYLLLYG